MNESMNNVAMFLNVYEKQPLITQPTPTKTNKKKNLKKEKHRNCCQISYEQSSDY